MPVDAAELDGRPVELDDAVFDLHLAHADLGRDVLPRAAERERVEVRRFRVPKVRVRQWDVDLALHRDARGHGRAAVLQLVPDVPAAEDLHVDGRAAARHQARLHREVADVPLRPAQQVDVPEDAGHAELVLVLGIGAAGPLDDQDADLVFAAAELVRDVELRGGVRHGGKARVGAVDPQEEGGIHALKVQVPALLRGRVERNLAHIQGAGVLSGHKGRVVGDGIAHIGVLVRVVPVRLPDGGHLHGHEVLLAQQGRLLQRRQALVVAEAPLAREPDHAVGVLAVRGRGGHPLPIGDVVGAVGFRALVQQVRVFQIGEKVHVSSPVLVRILSGLTSIVARLRASVHQRSAALRAFSTRPGPRSGSGQSAPCPRTCARCPWRRGRA